MSDVKKKKKFFHINFIWWKVEAVERNGKKWKMLAKLFWTCIWNRNNRHEAATETESLLFLEGKM